MKKKTDIAKKKAIKINPKKTKTLKKRLGMGLSSLLSSDTALDSIIGQNNKGSDIENSLKKVSEKIKVVSNQESGILDKTSDSHQTKLPIHSLVSGK